MQVRGSGPAPGRVVVGGLRVGGPGPEGGHMDIHGARPEYMHLSVSTNHISISLYKFL